MGLEGRFYAMQSRPWNDPCWTVIFESIVSDRIRKCACNRAGAAHVTFDCTIGCRFFSSHRSACFKKNTECESNDFMVLINNTETRHLSNPNGFGVNFRKTHDVCQTFNHNAVVRHTMHEFLVHPQKKMWEFGIH